MEGIVLLAAYVAGFLVSGLVFKAAKWVIDGLRRA